MTKLYIAIHILGNFIWATGPLPYSRDECISRINEAKSNLHLDSAIDGITNDDVQIDCVYRTFHPEPIKIP